MMRLIPIASSSSGNCIYLGNDNTHILVDVGISGKKVDLGLNSIGLKGEDIDAILITHEHIDHIGGLGIISRKYNIPIYSTHATFDAVKNNVKLGSIEEDLYHIIEPDKPFKIKDVEVEAFKTFHDAVCPVAYSFACGGSRAAIATDTGTFDEYMVSHLMGMNALLLEANHDVRMVQAGPYPYQTKQRILSDVGHLSNENCGRLLSTIMNDGLKGILLGHLSKENNYPELAYETVRLEINMSDNKYGADDFPIYIAKPDALSQCIDF